MFCWVKEQRVVKCDIIPVALIAFPGCVSHFVPDASIFGMTAGACTGIGVKFGGNSCLVWRELCRCGCLLLKDMDLRCAGVEDCYW